MLRTKVAETLLSLEMGRYCLRANLGIQLPIHDKAQRSRITETNRIGTKARGFILNWNNSKSRSPNLVENAFPTSNMATPSPNECLPEPTLT